jgi:hypothetical protein
MVMEEDAMGGKRPDQYRITPDEAGATDYKQRPNSPDEATVSDRTFSEAMETWSRENQPIPPDVIHPGTRKRREEHDRRIEAEANDSSEENEEADETESGPSR